MAAEPDPIVSSGKLVGGYRVEHRLGEGGMGTVYAATEPTIGKRVAIKVLKRDFARDESFAQRFEREAKSAAQIRHPAVIEIFAYGKLDDGRPFFVMPLLTGRSLRQALDERPRMVPDEAWRIAREVASGLSAAHAFGVLHRDLKPDNVFLVEHTGRPVAPLLLDFGLAKIAAGSEADDGEAIAKLTGTGTPIGTPLYMAPEQWWSAPATEATDQYGFGCLLFEMLAGRPPFEGTRFPELLQAHLHEKPPRLRDLGVEVPEAVDDLVARLLSKEASDRFASFDAVIQAGDTAFGRGAPVAPRTPERERATDRAALARTELHTTTGAAARTEKPALVPYLAWTAAVAAILPLVGYPGEIGRDIPLWLVSIGFGFIPILAASAAALVALPACVRRAVSQPVYGLLALGLVVLPAFFATVPLVMGWSIVTSHIGSLASAQAFEILHMGYYEVNVARFLGLGLTAAHAAGLAVLLGHALGDPEATPPPRSRLTYLLAAIAVAGGAALYLVGWVAPAVVAFAAAIRLGVTNWVPPTTTARLHLVIDRVLASMVATVAIVGVAFTRVEVTMATPFVTSAARSERVATLVDAARERNNCIAVLFFAIVALLAGAWASHGGRVFDPVATRAARARLPAGALIAAGVILTLAGVDIWVRSDFAARRHALVEQMREQLVFFARLVPPGAPTDRDLPRPTPAAALQISREAVALNGRPLGRLTALESDAGRQTILRELTSALAAPAAGGEGSGIDLSLLVDRSVPMSRVRELAGLAYQAGARTTEVLLTRGQLSEIPAAAPSEAGLLLPQDFVGLRVALLAREPIGSADATFEAFAADLLGAAGDGEAVIAVGAR